MYTSPRESKAEIRNSSAPKRLRKTGIIASSLGYAFAKEVYVLTLKIFCKSEDDSIETPSSAFVMIY